MGVFFLKAAYNQLHNCTRQAQKIMEKYLGHMIYKQMKKKLPDFKEPVYVHSNNYQHATGLPNDGKDKVFIRNFLAIIDTT